MNRRPIDIIIPIFNAYDDLVLCMRSIRKYTDLTTDRIVLINDCSTDARIRPYLETQAEENVLVINNEENRGFSNNVNRGFQLTADRDVLLLNSDTIVTKNWVDKIVACAYSAEEIGTVTPLSNSATLCSTPIVCQDNPIPENVSIDEYAAIIERCSLRRYPRITVAVGFCMFIKRKVIEKVGEFDAETFQRGYGEENDFCNRAGLLGFVHVMCDDTFIYHKGTVSFNSEEKKQLIANHDMILEERYPIQMRRNHLYCVKNPDQYIRDNINLFQRLYNNKRNLLYVVHSDFRADSDDNTGGTQLHVRDMAMNMKDKYNVFVLGRTADKLRLSIYNGNMPVDTFVFHVGDRPDYPVFRNTEHYKIYENILRAFKIELVHVHHISCLSFDIFYAAHALNIPIHMTLHDFYFVCPNKKLMSYGEQYCGGCEDTQNCRKCLKETCKISDTVNYISEWRSECRKALNMCEVIYTPSESTRDIFTSIYSELEGKIIPIYHGSEFAYGENNTDIFSKQICEIDSIQSNFDEIMDNPDDRDSLLGWAFLENNENLNNKIYIEVKDSAGEKYYINTTVVRRQDVADTFHNPSCEYCGFRAKVVKGLYRKGMLTMRIVIRSQGRYYGDKKTIEIKNTASKIPQGRMNVAFIGGLVPAKGSQLVYEMIRREQNAINWFIFGNIFDQDLSDLEQENFFNIGKYEKEHLPQLLTTYNIDIACILAIWPETFCYTISEALICNVPVLVSDIGAMGERIRKNGCGWIVDRKSTPEVILKKLLEIADNKADYMEKKERTVAYQEKSLKEMAEEYQSYYERSFIVRRNWDYDREMIAGAMVK